MKIRDSARAILLNDQNELLLIQHQDVLPVDPAQPDLLCYWATPGGGIEPGESPAEALRRELREELGLTEFAIGRIVGCREIPIDLPDAGRVLSRETYFVCHVTEIPELNRLEMSARETRTFRCCRWWSQSDLETAAENLRPPAVLELFLSALQSNQEPICLRE